MSINDRFQVRRILGTLVVVIILGLSGVSGLALFLLGVSRPPRKLDYQQRLEIFDASGYLTVAVQVKPWSETAPLEEIASTWGGTAARYLEELDGQLAVPDRPVAERVFTMIFRASVLNFLGKPDQAYQTLAEARLLADANPDVAEQWLYSIIYLQGVTALRRGENDNCIMCRGESSCILPIAPAVIHKIATGSKLAVEHFSEYLDLFSDDLDWMNVKLYGTKTNQSAIGARIKVVTGGPTPQTIYRHVTTGSSFGAKPSRTVDWGRAGGADCDP